MTDKQMDMRIAALLESYRKRIEDLERAQRGELFFRRIKVKEYKVREHTVGSHFRYIRGSGTDAKIPKRRRA